MSVTCQIVYARARAFSPRPPLVIPSTHEILARIQSDQQALFTATSHLARDRFKHTESLTSTSGSSARTVDLTGTTYPLERVLRVTLADEEVSQVDELDQDGELAPRYFVRGLTLVEVGTDWGSSGTKSLSLTYAYGPTDIDPEGALTQTITVPDAWADLLVLPLAMYLCTKDPQPNPAEYEKLARSLDERQAAYLEYLQGYGGVAARRFDLPTPRRSEQKQ